MLQSFPEIKKNVLFLYSDGGADHRLTSLSVQVSLIALFMKLDLEFLCAAQTAPSHSWHNPVEQVMSTLNLGLQCIGLMRQEMDPTFEAEVKKYNSLATLRDAARKVVDFKTTALNSIAHVKSLLVMLLDHLELKGKKFCIFSAASEDDLDLMWREVQKVDSTLVKDKSLTKKSLPSKPGLVSF